MIFALGLAFVSLAFFALGQRLGGWGLPMGLALTWTALVVAAGFSSDWQGGNDETFAQFALTASILVFLPVEAATLLGVSVARRRAHGKSGMSR